MNKRKLAFILFGIILFFACEKDDICVDADTPLLIIRFYDAADTTVLKPVPNLRVIGVGNGNPVNTFADRTAIDSIAIPLKTDALSTEFNFILNSADDDTSGNETGQINAVSFNYAVKEEFESRACGFIANYENLDTNFTPVAQNWIQEIEIVKTLVMTEEEVTAHVKIFH